MQINDPIYGTSEIRDDFLLKLIGSASMQRMKKVSQMGIPNDAIKGRLAHYSRFDHCVGTMLLLRRLGAPLEEQVAGLLHDVSHTAFSHVIDWIAGNPDKEDYQDSVHRSYIMHGELSGMLKAGGFDPERIADLGSFHLLERELPDLCADRVDYAFRDMYYGFGCDSKRMATDLIVLDGDIIFRSMKVAKEFGEGYLRCQREIWASTERYIEYHILSMAIKEGLDAGIITMNDMAHLGDAEVIGMLERAGNDSIQKKIDALRGRVPYKTTESGGVQLRKKLRYVDPKYLENGRLVRLSETDRAFEKLVERERERTAKGIKVNVLFE